MAIKKSSKKLPQKSATKAKAETKNTKPTKKAKVAKTVAPEIVPHDDIDEIEADLTGDVNHQLVIDPMEATSSASGGIVPSDPLQKYLSDLRKYPLLTPAEEKKLAVLYKETGDKAAAEKLVTSNLRFVVKVAAEYSKFGARMIDLIQEGNVGLMHAVKEFNPYKGVRLITYAVWWIRGYIQEYLMKNYSQVKIGTTQAQKKLFYHLNKEKAKLDSMGEAPNVKMLSERLGVTEQEVREMEQRLSGHDLSLDAPMGKSDEGNAKSFVENQTDLDASSADDALASGEEHAIFKREIKKIVKTLNEKEVYLLQNRILGDPPKTLQEVGDYFKITRERARQLEERVIEKLRKHFKEVFPDYKINVPEE